ncbi:MAG: GtrA family protein, partial [Nitrosotalea sp.]
IVWTLCVLDKWTFKQGIKKHGTVKRFLQYHVVALAGLGVNEIIFLFFTYVINLYYLLAEFLAILLTFGFNFILNKKLAWASCKKF